MEQVNSGHKEVSAWIDTQATLLLHMRVELLLICAMEDKVSSEEAREWESQVRGVLKTLAVLAENQLINAGGADPILAAVKENLYLLTIARV